MNVIVQQKGRDPLYKIWHQIDGHMIIHMCSDGGNIVFHDKLLPIKKGSLCYIGPGIYHYTLPYNPKGYIRNKIFISDDAFQRILDMFPKDSHFRKQFSEKNVLYAQLPADRFSEVDHVFSNAKQASDLCLLPDFLHTYLGLMIYTEKYATENIDAFRNYTAKAIAYINFNYHKDLSLDDICQATYVSKHHLCRMFKKTMGITVMEYVLSTRITAAQKKLVTSDCSIGEIAERCGFSSLAYFCQAFRRYTGLSAKQYRKNKSDFE